MAYNIDDALYDVTLRWATHDEFRTYEEAMLFTVRDGDRVIGRIKTDFSVPASESGKGRVILEKLAKRMSERRPEWRPAIAEEVRRFLKIADAVILLAEDDDGSLRWTYRAGAFIGRVNLNGNRPYHVGLDRLGVKAARIQGKAMAYVLPWGDLGTIGVELADGRCFHLGVEPPHGVAPLT
jgi:hypothetical protein